MSSIKVITSTVLIMVLTMIICVRITSHVFIEWIDIFGSESSLPMLAVTVLISIVPFLVGAMLLNVYLRINKKRIQRLKDKHNEASPQNTTD